MDEKVEIPDHTRLIDLPDSDPERDDFLRLSEASLAEAYSEEMVEYSKADLPDEP